MSQLSQDLEMLGEKLAGRVERRNDNFLVRDTHLNLGHVCASLFEHQMSVRRHAVDEAVLPGSLESCISGRLCNVGDVLNINNVHSYASYMVVFLLGAHDQSVTGLDRNNFSLFFSKGPLFSGTC